MPTLPQPNDPCKPSPPDREDVGLSHASLCFEGDGSVTLWGEVGASRCGTSPREQQLTLHPDRPVVIGRQQGGEVPYLDPSYVPTHIVPETGKSVLAGRPDGSDLYVSRGHFLLRAAPEGILLVNGVPRRGGGIRAPLNGTWLLQPEHRRLGDGEGYLILKGHGITIHLPNDTRVVISAG